LEIFLIHHVPRQRRLAFGKVSPSPFLVVAKYPYGTIGQKKFATASLAAPTIPVVNPDNLVRVSERRISIGAIGPNIMPVATSHETAKAERTRRAAAIWSE